MKLFFKNLWYYREVIWKKPNINRKSDKRSASYLELFFDLAFVSAISVFSNYIDYSWHNHQMFLWLLFFYFLWSVWFNITLYSDRFETSGIRYRLLLWANMIPCLIMAFGFSETHLIARYSNNTLLELKGTYIFGFVTSRLLIAIIYLDIVVNSSEQNSFIYQNYFFPAIGFIISPLLMFTSYAWSDNFNFTHSKHFGEILFSCIAVIEFVFTTIPLFMWSEKLPRLHKTHITDRFVLFTLITLGEIMLTSFVSLIDTNKLNFLLTNLNLNYIYLIWRFSVSILLIFLIWWVYTDWVGSIIYTKTKHNRKIILYSYAHFGLVVGLLLISRGIDGINTVSTIVHSGHTLSETQAIISSSELTDIYGGEQVYIYTKLFNIGCSIYLISILLIMFTTNLKFASQNFEANNHEITLWLSIVAAIVTFATLTAITETTEDKHFVFFFEVNIYIAVGVMLYLIINGIVVWMLYFQRQIIAGNDKN